MSTPSIVLVHGAFADGSSWSKVLALLAQQGQEAVAVQCPLSSLADDAGAVRRAIRMQPGPVLLVGHSWGGVVISEAGGEPGVAGLVYVAAGAPDAGQSFNDWWKDYPTPPGAASILPYGEDRVALTREGVRRHFVPELPQQEADLVYATQGPLATRCFTDTVARPAWRDKRCWYVVAGADQIIPPAVERDSARRMNAETVLLDSGHVPMLSQPRAIADLILRAARALA